MGGERELKKEGMNVRVGVEVVDVLDEVLFGGGGGELSLVVGEGGEG